MGERGETEVPGGASIGRTAIARLWLAIWGIMALAVALRLWAYSPFDIAHADELMQYLEQANRLVTGSGILPWESRFGLRNSLIPQLLSAPVWLGHALAPGTLAHVHLARLGFLALTLLALPAAWRLGALASWRHGLVALFVVATWWESILFSNLLLSESLASALLLFAAATLLDERATRPALALGGLLLGLGVLVRLQYAPFAAVLALWTLAREPARWRALVTGGLAAMVVGIASDLVAGAVPFSWILVNFSKNIGEGIAARFSTSPAWQYLIEYYLHFGPGPLLFVAIAALAAGKRYRPLLAAAVVNVAVHSLIAHKEYRFVWVSTLVLLVLAAIGSVRIIEHLLERRGRAGSIGWRSAIGATAIWGLLSVTSFQQTGGYGAFRGGGALSRLAIAAAERPNVCRLAVVEAYYAHVAPSILPRPLPLSIAPKGVYERQTPLPLPLAKAANALLAERRPLGTDVYAEVACLDLAEERACLYVRPGSCAPDPAYDFQTALERGGM